MKTIDMHRLSHLKVYKACFLSGVTLYEILWYNRWLRMTTICPHCAPLAAVGRVQQSVPTALLTGGGTRVQLGLMRVYLIGGLVLLRRYQEELLRQQYVT